MICERCHRAELDSLSLPPKHTVSSAPNEPIVGDDKEHIYANIRSAKSSIATLDQLIERAQRQRDEAEQFVVDKTDVLSPIRNLPVELLVTIFESTANDEAAGLPLALSVSAVSLC